MEELLDAIIAEEGQTLMGLDFLIETLDLPMKKIDLLFKKALSEYSERRPMKKTTIINNFDYMDGDGNNGYIMMPEGTTSCRVARYGVLPNQMPRYYMPKFGEQNVEFDITTRTCRVWPPVTPLRLTYTQRFSTTTNVLIERIIDIPYETDEYDFVLPTYFAGKTLSIQKNVSYRNPDTGEWEAKILSMQPTGYTNERQTLEGDVVQEAILKGTLGRGTVNLKTREVNLEFTDESTAPLVVNYYPKYSVVKELDIGNYLFTKIFACKIITALASLRAQVSQEKLHNVDLDQQDLVNRAAELKKEIRELGRSGYSFGDLAPM
jgi:hypothetical protein